MIKIDNKKKGKLVKIRGLIKRKNNKRTISFNINDNEIVLDKILSFTRIIRNK